MAIVVMTTTYFFEQGNKIKKKVNVLWNKDSRIGNFTRYPVIYKYTLFLILVVQQNEKNYDHATSSKSWTTATSRAIVKIQRWQRQRLITLQVINVNCRIKQI